LLRGIAGVDLAEVGDAFRLGKLDHMEPRGLFQLPERCGQDPFADHAAFVLEPDRAPGRRGAPGQGKVVFKLGLGRLRGPAELSKGTAHVVGECLQVHRALTESGQVFENIGFAAAG